MKAKKTVYDIVTDQILEQLYNGVAPWRMTWDDKNAFPGVPANASTMRPYSGINFFLLSFLGGSYQFPYYMTINQVNNAGGSVKKGAKSKIVTYFMMKYTIERGGKKVTIKEHEVSQYPKERVTSIPILRYYRVFNIADVEGIDFDLPTEKVTFSESLLDEVAAKFIGGPEVYEGGGSAHYQELGDKVCMPKKDRFTSIEEYYCTLWHELVHATGHSNRLNREGIGKCDKKDKLFEELVAELGAAFLCAMKGISYATQDNSASYINDYIELLEADKRIIFKAARQAHEAVEYIIDQTRDIKQEAA